VFITEKPRAGRLRNRAATLVGSRPFSLFRSRKVEEKTEEEPKPHSSMYLAAYAKTAAVVAPANAALVAEAEAA